MPILPSPWHSLGTTSNRIIVPPFAEDRTCAENKFQLYCEASSESNRMHRALQLRKHIDRLTCASVSQQCTCTIYTLALRIQFCFSRSQLSMVRKNPALPFLASSQFRENQGHVLTLHLAFQHEEYDHTPVPALKLHLGVPGATYMLVCC